MASSGSESIQWTDWDASAFERARELDRPVLLTIVASWCRYCRELDETTFSDKEVIKRVNESYLAVRVDKDRRPDINARYNCGGWPTVAFLTPDADLIAGESFLTAAELLPILEKVAPFFREHRSEIHARVEELEAIRIRQQERKIQGPLTADIIDVVGASIVESFDSVHGGFGKASKFPQTEAIEFALAQYARHGDEQMREVVVKTLDAMVDGEIHDTIEGGFFRYAQARDWRSPNTEKVLDSNAARLRCYLEAYQLFRNESYRSAADGILRWLDSRMLDSETGGFFGSQDADPQYYGLADGAAPHADRAAGRPHDLRGLERRHGLRAIVGIGGPRRAALARRRAPRRRVPRRRDVRRKVGDVSLLGRHVPPPRAPHRPGLHAARPHRRGRLFGDSRFLDAAVKLAEVLRHRHLSPNGGFYDISHDAPSVKRPARRNRSILENSILADAFVRLGLLARDESYNKTAREALESFTSDFRQYGYYAAGYARAVDLLFHPPLHVTIVGDPNDPRASGLRFAALATYQPNRLVDSVDPNHEPARLAHSGLPAREIPTAFIAVGRSSYAELTDPDEIASVMSMAERDRL